MPADRDGLLVLLECFEEVCGQKQAVYMIWAQRERHLGVKDGVFRTCLAAQCCGDRIEDFGESVPHGRDVTERHRRFAIGSLWALDSSIMFA